MSSYSATILADTPVGYWRLGEASGTTAADGSGNSHGGTYSGGYTLGVAGALAGDPDKAVLFDGASGQVVTTQTFTPAVPVSLECWVNLASTSLKGEFMNLGAPRSTPGATDSSGWGIGVGASDLDTAGNNLVGMVNDLAWLPSGVAIGTGWHHVVLTVDATSVCRLYLDGKLVYTSAAKPFNARAGAVSIGGFNANAGNAALRFFNGGVDEATYYNTALTDAQVLSHYNAGITPPPSGGMSNPMTTAGDLIVGGAGGAPQRLGVGTAGQVLTVASSTPNWATPPNPGGGTGRAIWAEDNGVLTDGTSGQGAKLQALIDKLDLGKGGKGGMIHFRGRITCDDRPVTPGAAGVSFSGEGMVVSQIYFPKDFGPNTQAMPQNTGSQETAPRHRGVGFCGPGFYNRPPGNLTGASPVKMDGVTPGSNVAFDHCGFFGFNANILILQDHNRFYGCKSADGFWSAFWGWGPQRMGNHEFRGCDLDGALYCTIGVAGDNQLQNCKFDGGHGGFSPYGVMKLHDANGQAQRALAVDTVFDAFSWESIGNGAIWDSIGSAPNPTGGGLFHTTINKPGFNWDQGVAYTLNGDTSKRGNAVWLLIQDKVTYHGGYTPFAGANGQAGWVFSRNYGNPWAVLANPGD